MAEEKQHKVSMSGPEIYANGARLRQARLDSPALSSCFILEPAFLVVVLRVHYGTYPV